MPYKPVMDDAIASYLVDIRGRLDDIATALSDLAHAVRNLPERFAATGFGEDPKKSPDEMTEAMYRLIQYCGLGINIEHINGDPTDHRVENIRLTRRS